MLSRKGTVSLSNTNDVSTEASDGTLPTLFASSKPTATGDWELTTFATLPPVSSYLGARLITAPADRAVTFANGPFVAKRSEYKSALTGRTIPLAHYTTAEHLEQTGLALEIAAKALETFERLFNLAFPLPKLDTLTVSAFAMGAMEGWGLMTGRLETYLFDERSSGLAGKRRVVTVQCHEVSHQCVAARLSALTRAGGSATSSRRSTGNGCG